MKRELKQLKWLLSIAITNIIAKPIPMKRELKPSLMASAWSAGIKHCKAYPDEKGIETRYRQQQSYCEKMSYCKAYPDEKGIETSIVALIQHIPSHLIAKPIPMKRELKRIDSLTAK